MCLLSPWGARAATTASREEGEGGAKLQNIVSHRSACKLAGIYLIRGQSAYIRVCRLEGEKNARGKKGRVKDARRASRRSSSFFFLFFFYPTNSTPRLPGIPRFRGQFRSRFGYYIFSRIGIPLLLAAHTHTREEIRISWPTQLLSPARVNGDLRFVSIRGRVQVQERLCV